ncbi:hypothetical protein DPEC_G00166750 [Dallia pectoralis]|uniref:Uncharacterized protein n=1 Tax=Dallia pectoralis TaxID=75939 RepID=A0ACC2GHU8_DALPE|nr:hypothetical protein DPEC_G00166750 [Dallia pectoralis]
MKPESGEEEFESEEEEELAMEEEEQANEEEEFKSEEEEEQANKAEEKVQEGEQQFTVATIIGAFRQHNRVERMPHRGGRVAIFTAAQETLIVDMVRDNNLITLREIGDKVNADNLNFESIDDVSLATIDRVLRRQKMRMKQVIRVPFECNSARHNDLCYEYVQRILQLDAMARPQEYLFLDEAGFNLQKQRQRGRNIISQRAITEVPGQRGVFGCWRGGGTPSNIYQGRINGTWKGLENQHPRVLKSWWRAWLSLPGQELVHQLVPCTRPPRPAPPTAMELQPAPPASREQ